MQKIIFAVCTLGLFLCSSPASADPFGRDHRQIERGRLQLHGEFHQGYRHGHGYRGHGWGWAPWFGAAVIGSGIYWANQYTPPPSTIIVAPPTVVDPGRVAYFCQTAQQYYPMVSTCNVPWQLVNY